MHQKAVINELRDAKGTGKVVCCKSSRQKGKSYMIANLLLYYSINNSKTKNYCVSPTLKQAKSVYKTIIDAISQSGIVQASNATDLEIKLINGSTICFKSAEQRNALRGYTADFLCIDECCFIPDDIFYLILPWVDAHKAPILMTSTPFVKEGFFWRYYNYGLNYENNTITIDWCDEIYREDIEKILPPEKLAEYKKVLPKNQFASEYLGEWLDDDGQVFTHFKECINTNTISPSDTLYVGIDWANGTDNDDTVISIMNQDGKQVLLVYWNDLTPTQQIDNVYAVLNQYEDQIAMILPELNSIGTPYTDMLKEKFKGRPLANKVEGFQTTNQSKADLVAILQVAFEKNQIEILKDEKQIRELGIYSAEYNPKTRTVSYNAPQGLHDDICIALMLSYNAYKTGTIIGQYCIGFK